MVREPDSIQVCRPPLPFSQLRDSANSVLPVDVLSGQHDAVRGIRPPNVFGARCYIAVVRAIFYRGQAAHAIRDA